MQSTVPGLIWWQLWLESLYLRGSSKWITVVDKKHFWCWRCTDQVTEIGGGWNCMANKCHINSLELQAAFFCLEAFCKNKTTLHVLLKLDNTAAVAYINKNRGTISAFCNKLAKDIWDWAKGQDIWITASHVLGAKNTLTALRCGSFSKKIQKKHLCHHDKNYYYFSKSSFPVIDLIVGSGNMIKLSKSTRL